MINNHIVVVSCQLPKGRRDMHATVMVQGRGDCLIHVYLPTLSMADMDLNNCMQICSHFFLISGNFFIENANLIKWVSLALLF